MLFPVLLFSQGLERIDLKSNIYIIEDFNSITGGYAPSFFSRPYSKNQIAGSSYKTMGLYFKPILNLSIRGQYLNSNIEDEKRSYWYNRWLENAPLLNLGFIAGNSYFLIYTDFDIRHDFFGGFNNNTYINIPYRDFWYQDFDFNFPTRGYLIFGNRELQLLIGRDKLQFGPGQRGSLMISGNSPFFNQLNLSYTTSSFKASYFFIPLESFLSEQEKNQLDEFINSESSLLPKGNFGKTITEQSKFLTGHRFEFKPNRRLMFSFTDMLVVGGRFPNFEDISPSMFYHNVYGENYSNVMIGFDFFYVPIDGLGFYGEFIIDDIRNEFEKEKSVPTSLGYLGGVKYGNSINDFRFILNIETALVDPFTYLRWHPYTSFYSRRKYISTSVNENIYLDSPIGFFLGPDSLFFTLWTDIIYRGFNVSLGWEYRKRGVIEDLNPEDFLISYSKEVDRDYFESRVIYLKGSYIINKRYSIDLKEELYIEKTLFNVVSISLNITL